MDNQKKIELIAEALEMEASELKPETVLDELDNWDSMSSLSLIVVIDENFGKKVTANDIRSFKTVEDIINFMG